MGPLIVAAGISVVDVVSLFDTYPQENSKNVAKSTAVGTGGNAANIACGLALMGARVQLCTSIYSDHHGKLVDEEVCRCGVDLLPVRIDGTTAASYIAVAQDTATRTIFHTPASPPLLAAHVPESVDVGADAALLLLDGRLYPLASRIAEQCLARQPGLPVILDCERHNREGLADMLSVATVVVCTEGFLRLRYSQDSLPDAVSSITQEGLPRLQAVIVTLGEQGCIVSSNSTASADLPAFASLDQLAAGAARVGSWRVVKVDAAKLMEGEAVQDTTGAGDAFQAGLAFALVRGLPLEDAARVASRVALRNCLAMGTRNFPSAHEAEQWCEQ